MEDEQEIVIPLNQSLKGEEISLEQKSLTPSAPKLESPVPEIQIPTVEPEVKQSKPIVELKTFSPIKQEPMTPLSTRSEPGKPLAESTPTTKEEAIAEAVLDIKVPSPSDTPVKKDLQTQLSDTQNSDRYIFRTHFCLFETKP